MQLMFFTDYAIRMLVHLAQRPGRFVMIKTIEAELGVPRNHLMKITKHLVDEGYLKTMRSRHGGICLKVSASEIRLGQLIHRAEGHSQVFNQSAMSHSTCFSAVRAVQQAYDAFIVELDEVTVADLARASVADNQSHSDDAARVGMRADPDSFAA